MATRIRGEKGGRRRYKMEWRSKRKNPRMVETTETNFLRNGGGPPKDDKNGKAEKSVCP